MAHTSTQAGRLALAKRAVRPWLGALVVLAVALVAAVTVSVTRSVPASVSAGAPPSVVSAQSGQTARAGRVTPIDTVVLTSRQRADFARRVSTPAKAAAFQADLNAAFRGVATVQFVPRAGQGAREAFAQGWDGDHWWMTMSYADAAGGAIDAATAACATRLPGYICTTARAILRSWVAGQSPVANHGVWLAIYWYGRITGGRW